MYGKKASFSLRKKDYESIISRIKTANSVLHDLAGQNRGLESSRRRRSQARVIKLIRGLSQSIFNALRSATTCRCAQSHDVCLELVSRKAAMVPSDVGDKVAKNFSFHVVLGSYESPDADAGCSDEDERIVRPLEQPTRWDSLHVQFEPKSKHNPKLPSSLSVALRNPESPSPRRSVRFFESFGSISRQESTSATEALTVVSERNMFVATAPVPIAVLPPVLSSGLCQVVFTWHEERKNPEAQCCGYIADPHRRFGLYPQHHDLVPRSAVTLRQMLEGGHNKFQGLDLLEKLRVALAISVSILHLYNYLVSRYLSATTKNTISSHNTIHQSLNTIAAPSIQHSLVGANPYIGRCHVPSGKTEGQIPSRFTPAALHVEEIPQAGRHGKPFRNYVAEGTAQASQNHEPDGAVPRRDADPGDDRAGRAGARHGTGLRHRSQRHDAEARSGPPVQEQGARGGWG
ncbi:hypothetical protein FDECE_14006 [Fusarium decemcellulare]|nr:hypothetical protein FDECE_14006 [Fusarium decemcellulare]